MRKIPMLMTRPEGANAAFAAEIPPGLADRLEFVDCPLMRITSLARQNAMAGDDAAIFTSVNAVRYAPPAMDRRAFCVGARTTRAAGAAGWQAVFAGQTAEELIAHLTAQPPGVRLYHLSGKHVRGDVVGSLTAAGLSAKRIVLYDQILLPLSPAALSLLAQERPVIVPLFSPRAAAHFVATAPINPQVKVASLSAAVTESLSGISEIETITAAEPTADALLACVEKLVETIHLG